MVESAIDAAQVAECSHDPIDVDQFYSHVCGAEDIHIGIYHSAAETIADASRRTVTLMASWLPGLSSESTVIDLGAGYGSAARYLARTYGCRVTSIGLSVAQAGRNRRLNQRAALADRIEVLRGEHEHLPVPSGTYDVAWSQDAIPHNVDRRRVLEEVRRVLRPSGRFIFTDSMHADDTPSGELDPLYARLRRHGLGSPSHYRSVLGKLGFREERSADLTDQLVAHYTRIGSELEERAHELVRHASQQYLASLNHALGQWIAAGRSGLLRWGIYCFVR